MVGMNPCYCWNLKDGCITVGIWTLICSIIQLAIFSWQSYVIKWERDKTANRRLPFYGTQSSYDFRYYGPDYSSFYMYSLSQVAIFGWQTWIIRLLKDKASNERYTPNLGAWRPEGEKWKGYFELAWMTDEERRYFGLFVIQILCLISAFFLLFGSVSLIYGIHTNSKHLVWPWFPCVVSSILCSVAYCITWWASGVDNYWLILTIIEWFSVMINLYALLCVIVQYRRILRNYDEYSEEQKVPVVVWDDQNQKGNFTETKLGPEAYWNKTFEEEPKPAVKSNVSAKGPSQFIGTQFGQKQMPYHAQITSALDDPGHVLERYTTEPGIKANDRYDARSFTALNVATDEAELPAKENRSENDIFTPSVPIAKRQTEDEILRSKSVDALTAQLEEKDRRSVPHSKSKESITTRHRHRSHSHHRGDRRGDYYSDEETDIARSVAGSRSRISETDTGYSCSDGSRRSRHRRRHHSHDESERGHHHRHRRHRRPRDVKRDDRERSHSNNNNNNNVSNANNRQSSTNSSPAAVQAGLIGMPLPTYSPYEMGAVRLDPNYGLSQMLPSYALNPAFNQANLLQAVNPSYSPVGGIQVLPTGLPHNSSIGATNAHITKPIPGQTGSQPQKFQINSEIFISYNNDPANQASRPSSRQQVIQLQPVVGAASLGSKQHSPGVDFNETMEPRNSSAAGSVDSKSTGATAV
ncbi:Transmembrane channel-like protein [Trichinella spiralis]|uniref:Transmembrane channel-like protein n=1 Tax=Trichinella spiralis TaxID=6334 RepID=A0ABR3KL00_TRISP